MAQDIIPIELGLPQGDVVTLWAPRWREDGEEWEAFLGDEDDLYAFPDAAHLAAFVRTSERHDLIDHPAWDAVPSLNVPELIPDEDHTYDLVGVPELVAEEPDIWHIAELAEIVGIVRSLADVCDLEEVHEILDSTEGFSLLDQGTLPFTGSVGVQVWNDLSETVSHEVGHRAGRDRRPGDGAGRRREGAGADGRGAGRVPRGVRGGRGRRRGRRGPRGVDSASEDDDEEEEDEGPVGFWAEVGIDPIKIITSGAEYYTLRCYLDDAPVFLGSEGEIDVFTSEKALARALADGKDLADTDLAEVSTWDEVLAKATAGELEVEVDPENTYVLTGLDADIAEGPEAIDPTQLELAVELITDAADWAGDDSAETALAGNESLGWLVSFVLRPDPTRLEPSAPFDAEQSAWRKLVEGFENRLTVA